MKDESESGPSGGAGGATRLEQSFEGVTGDPDAVLRAYLPANLRRPLSIHRFVEQPAQLGQDTGRGIAAAGDGAGDQ